MKIFFVQFIIITIFKFGTCPYAHSYSSSDDLFVDACIRKLKDNIENNPSNFSLLSNSFLTSTSILSSEQDNFSAVVGEANSVLSIVNDLFHNSVQKDKFYTGSYSVDHQPYKLKVSLNLELPQELSNHKDINRLMFNYSIKYINTNNSKNPSLFFLITAKVEKKSLPLYEVSQVFNFTDYQNCIPILNNMKMTIFEEHSKELSVLKVKNLYFNLNLNTISQEGPKFISKNDLKNTVDKLKNFNYLKENKNFKFFSNSLLDVIEVKANEKSNELYFDHWLSQETYFKKIQLEFYYLNNKIGPLYVFSSTNSQDFFSDYPQRKIYGRFIPYELWSKTTSLKSLEEENNLVKGFEEEDFNADRLNYKITLNTPLETYPSISSYGSWAKIDHDKDEHYSYSFQSLNFDLIESPSLLVGPKDLYLEETQFFDYSHSNIKKLIYEINKLDPNHEKKSWLEILTQISNIVKREISIDDLCIKDSNNNKSLKASEIVERKKGVCGHFSTLFVTLARGLGLPARLISGWYIQSNKLIRHHWVEILNEKNQWVPIEPQWTKLKLSRAYIPRTNKSVESLPLDTLESEIKGKEVEFNILHYHFDAVLEKVEILSSI